MAKVDSIPLLAGVRGSIGNLILVRRNGMQYLRRKPSPKPKQTPARQAHQGRFAQASAYAGRVLAQPEEKAVYEAAARGTGLSAQNLAIRDFMNPPTLEDIDSSAYTGNAGQTIRVKATDDFEIVRLTITIRDESGTALEEGAAVASGEPATWQYLTQRVITPSRIIVIEATAWDRPGNSAVRNTPHWGG
jgi:hypothetical protein